VVLLIDPDSNSGGRVADMWASARWAYSLLSLPGYLVRSKRVGGVWHPGLEALATS